MLLLDHSFGEIGQAMSGLHSVVVWTQSPGSTATSPGSTATSPESMAQSPAGTAQSPGSTAQSPGAAARQERAFYCQVMSQTETPPPSYILHTTFAIGIPQWKYDLLFIDFCKK